MWHNLNPHSLVTNSMMLTTKAFNFFLSTPLYDVYFNASTCMIYTIGNWRCNCLCSTIRHVLCSYFTFLPSCDVAFDCIQLRWLTHIVLRWPTCDWCLFHFQCSYLNRQQTVREWDRDLEDINCPLRAWCRVHWWMQYTSTGTQDWVDYYPLCHKQCITLCEAITGSL